MLISHKHQFLFVHIPKTAGSSVQKALIPYSNEMPNDRLSKMRSKIGWIKDRERFYLPKHADYNFAKERLGINCYEKLFKFAFVRNPWDLLVSYYSYIQKNSNHHRHKKIAVMNSFEEYVNYEMSRNKSSQSEIIYDKKDNLKIDYFGRFETLEEDFYKICKRIGIEAKLPHVNASTHSQYQSFYNDKLRDQVASHWARDIELLGYTFEDNEESKISSK